MAFDASGPCVGGRIRAQFTPAARIWPGGSVAAYSTIIFAILLIYGVFQDLDGQGILAADVDEPLAGADREGADEHPFENGMGISFPVEIAPSAAAAKGRDTTSPAAAAASERLIVLRTFSKAHGLAGPAGRSVGVLARGRLAHVALTRSRGAGARATGRIHRTFPRARSRRFLG